MTVKEARIKAGMTQAQLAEKTGIPISTIQKYERGFRDIMKAEVGTVLKIAEAMNMTIEELIK